MIGVKAIAFAPGHISGFFEPVYAKQDFARSGSRGAGINVSLGAISEVVVKNSLKQDFQIFINNKKSNVTVTKLALRYILGEKPVSIVVKTNIELPTGQGFGMSAASALSATLALAKIIGVTSTDAMKAAHCAEVQLKTGLTHNLILLLLRSENFFSLSQTFTKKTELADKRILEAINVANKFGMASMCMLGNSVFAIGKTDEICKVLSSFGKLYVCSVDESGARILEG